MSHWVADLDTEQVEIGSSMLWQPCLDTEEGHIPCLPVWFGSRQECEDWIRRYAVGADLR